MLLEDKSCRQGGATTGDANVLLAIQRMMWQRPQKRCSPNPKRRRCLVASETMLRHNPKRGCSETPSACPSSPTRSMNVLLRQSHKMKLCSDPERHSSTLLLRRLRKLRQSQTNSAVAIPFGVFPAVPSDDVCSASPKRRHPALIRCSSGS